MPFHRDALSCLEPADLAPDVDDHTHELMPDDQRDVDGALLAGAGALVGLLGTASTPIAGMLADTYGVRNVASFGFASVCIGFLLLAAMPCGVNVLLVVNAFGLDRRLAASMIAWSTALVLVAVLGTKLAIT